jgi:hypothetical protein
MAQHGYLREYDEDYSGGVRDRAFRDEERENRGRFMFGDEDRRYDPDAHYRSWRDKQMRAMDRDYEEYRREREQEFHADFEAWRQQRHANPQPLQTGMTQSGLSDTTGTLELTSPAAVETPTGPDPTATATLGTTSGARRRRS